MSFVKSKIFGALLVLGFVGIGISVQSGKDQSEQETGQQAEEATATPEAGSIVRSNTEDQHSKFATAAVSALSSSLKDNSSTVKKAQEPAEDDELSALIGNAISELGSLAQEENSYIDALTGSSSIQGGDADHLNKIDFSSLMIKKKRPVQSFESQMDSLVGSLMGMGIEKSTRKPEKMAVNKAAGEVKESLLEDNGSVAEYIASLSKEAETRRNEVRMITVTEGETLWKIAARAYGDGNLYKKIYEANPHIKNPNMIEVGEMLRVPI